MKHIAFLYAPVDVKGQGAGPYIGPISKVTVQGKDQHERYAVLRDGFWFAAYDDQRYYTGGGVHPPKQDSDLIDDAGGPLVYDSAKNGAVAACVGAVEFCWSCY